MGVFIWIFGASLVVLGVVVELAWLEICFGSVILGIVLLLFVPWILILPLGFISGLGLALILKANQDVMIIKKQQDYDNLLLQENKIDDVFDV